MSIVTEETVTVCKVDWAELAEQLEVKIMEEMKQGLEYWENDEVSMRAMVLADAASGLEVCNSMTRKKLKEIIDRLREMDTAPREMIYQWIEDISGYDIDYLVENSEAVR